MEWPKLASSCRLVNIGGGGSRVPYPGLPRPSSWDRGCVVELLAVECVKIASCEPIYDRTLKLQSRLKLTYICNGFLFASLYSFAVYT